MHPNPMHVALEISPMEKSGVYSQIRLHRTAAVFQPVPMQVGLVMNPTVFRQAMHHRSVALCSNSSGPAQLLVSVYTSPQFCSVINFVPGTFPRRMSTLFSWQFSPHLRFIQRCPLATWHTFLGSSQKHVCLRFHCFLYSIIPWNLNEWCKSITGQVVCLSWFFISLLRGIQQKFLLPFFFTYTV